MAKGSFEGTARTYDAIARRYRAVKKRPFQDYVVDHSLFGLIGDPTGKTVLDLGCGEGHNTRWVMRHGAAAALGVDISSEMIRLAEDRERAGSLGCRYRVADAAGLELGERFDLVVGAFLLNYAASREQLRGLCRAIVRALKPGGRFVGVNANMALDPARYDDCRNYGRWQTTTAERREGDPITVHLVGPDGTEVQFENFYLSPATYESVFAEAGLEGLSWRAISVSPAGLAAHPEGYWDALLAAPPIVGIEARKAGGA